MLHVAESHTLHLYITPRKAPKLAWFVSALPAALFRTYIDGWLLRRRLYTHHPFSPTPLARQTECRTHIMSEPPPSGRFQDAREENREAPGDENGVAARAFVRCGAALWRVHPLRWRSAAAC